MTAKRCRCTCGYRCGGPGKCELPWADCIAKSDGKHFVRDCDHKFEGPMVDQGDGCHSVVCSVCGMSCMSHDMMVGP